VEVLLFDDQKYSGSWDGVFWVINGGEGGIRTLDTCVYTLSRRAPSATRTPHQNCRDVI
jgi:hypothetical protein